MPGDHEIELAGGNLTRVVRVGETVRRSAGPWTPMVHSLLVHLRDRGLELAPAPLGLDDEGREVLTFIEGETVTTHPWPRWVWSDALLIEACRSLASYHRAVADFRPALVESRLGTTRLADDEIVCHNDFAPYNAVFREGHLVGIFDWDVVCAARPSWDLAFLAWHWVPLHAPSPALAWRTTAECQRRLRLVVEAYGPTDTSDLVGRIVERIDASRCGILSRAAAGDVTFARLAREGHAEDMEHSIEFVHAIEDELRDGLDARPAP